MVGPLGAAMVLLEGGLTLGPEKLGTEGPPDRSDRDGFEYAENPTSVSRVAVIALSTHFCLFIRSSLSGELEPVALDVTTT
jgi:hypothetical protein